MNILLTRMFDHSHHMMAKAIKIASNQWMSTEGTWKSVNAPNMNQLLTICKTILVNLMQFQLNLSTAQGVMHYLSRFKGPLYSGLNLRPLVKENIFLIYKS